MHVGRRVAQLRAAHGESLREAAQRTGVSHTTIARIEKGEVSGSFHSTLRKIAEGYGVQLDFLIAGRDPHRDFQALLRRLSFEERTRLYFVSPRTRIRMVLGLLTARHPGELPAERLASALVASDRNSPQTAGTALEEAAAELSRLTGIPSSWFLTGQAEEEELGPVPAGHLQAYIRLAREAARAGIQPEMLAMAIDLLIMKQEEMAVSAVTS